MAPGPCSRPAHPWPRAMLVEDIVFSVDGEDYRWRDVIVAGVRWGEWRSTERRARDGAACARYADANGIVPDKRALDAAAKEFRYARDLVTASSMEEWLQRWSITAREWTAYF